MGAGSPVETARRGTYEVLRRLAVGGMAELHLVRAHDPEHAGRLMVVKRLHPRLALDPEYVRMFLDEAHIASTLCHPNIVEVYEINEQTDEYYIAMEHLHGHDLRDTLVRMIGRGVPVQIEQALTIARAVAAGLHYTHERTDADGTLLGIVHRDVSPHNVLLTYDGDVKIVDFGVAKASSHQSRTRTGVLKGKVAYMSPEQAMGQPLDRRSDVFCIGILLWEMTTGRWLYRRRSELETLNAVVKGRPPRPSRLAPGCPRDLEKLVMKTLARSRDDRWASAAELIDAIDELARRRRLTLGPPAVSALMATAFVDELSAWRSAQSLGTSLGDHLVAQAEAAAARRASSGDDDDDDVLPQVAALGGVAGEYTPRWRWPVIIAAVVVSVATAWFVSSSSRAEEPTFVPSTPGTPGTSGTPGSANVAPTASAPATPAPATSDATAPRRSPGEGVGSGLGPRKPAAAKPPAAKPPTAKPPTAQPSGPARRAGTNAPAGPAATPPPTDGPPPRKPAPPRAPPTLDDLDKIPP